MDAIWFTWVVAFVHSVKSMRAAQLERSRSLRSESESMQGMGEGKR